MRRQLLLVVLALAPTIAFVAPAAASPPRDVTITIAEVFHPNGPPNVTGDVTASGGVFGQATLGSLESQSFTPVGFDRSRNFPPPHFFEYTAVDKYTFDGGSFLITFQASCGFAGFDSVTNHFFVACSGNWRVNGGTGVYTLLKGTGTFTEQQDFDNNNPGAGTGTVTELGRMQSG